MPDPTLKTISATEAPGLFNASPYVTRWMLFQKFAKGISLDTQPDARMTWGKKLQPLILEHVAAELRLEIRPNAEDAYARRGLLGCTRDAMIFCPDRGPGAVETKCVFDYGVWMADWNGGRQPPRHHELQLQQQMFVGDENGSFTWGVLPAWVCGDIKYFERKPMPDLWRKLEDEAAKFFDDVAAMREPDPFGSAIEVPWLRELFPPEKGKTIDLSAHPDASRLVEIAVAYKNAKEQEAAGARTAEPGRAQLLAVAKDAEEIILPEGVRVSVRASGPHNGRRIKVYVPELGITSHGRRVDDDLIYAG